MPQVEKTLDLTCSMGGKMAWKYSILWEGIPLSYLLNLAGAPSVDKLDRIWFQAVTGYKKYITGKSLENPDNMIALKAEGSPLTMQHGFPARVVAPGVFGSGYSTGGPCVKYVTAILCDKKS
jgi:DMSO/TMAO reductase YedYZ molybdopterin-dependent catalytic subunit